MNSGFVNLIILQILLSCSEISGNQYIDSNDLIPPKPFFWDYFSVDGKDSDKDLVRDDVELWINEEFSDVNVRRAAKQLVKAFKMQDKSSNQEEFLTNRELVLASRACLSFVSVFEKKDYTVSYYVQKKYYNNLWREKKNKNTTGKYLESGVFTLNLNPYYGWKSCRFQVGRLKELMSYFLKDPFYRKKLSVDEYSLFVDEIGRNSK